MNKPAAPPPTRLAGYAAAHAHAASGGASGAEDDGSLRPLARLLERRSGAQILGRRGDQVHVRDAGGRLTVASILLADDMEADGSWWTEAPRLRAFLETEIPRPATQRLAA